MRSMGRSIGKRGMVMSNEWVTYSVEYFFLALDCIDLGAFNCASDYFRKSEACADIALGVQVLEVKQWAA